MQIITIAGKHISPEHRPFIIAEMSGNHNQSLDKALAIVEAAAAAGADAIKLQTYTADTMTIQSEFAEFNITDPASLWYGRSLYDLYQEAHTPWEWHAPLMQRASELGLICFSTPFDETAVDFLESLQVPAYKIASFENTDVRLLKKVAQTGKPVIISTGMADLQDLQLMVQTLRQHGCEQFVLLKCTSAYPATPRDANLRTIPHLKDMFHCHVGLSDHTMGIGVSVAAVALGAAVIEKHFTLDRSAGGVDAAFSLEPHELRALVQESEKAWQALGQVSYQMNDNEKKSCQYKRSIYFVKDLSEGDIITEESIRAIRPGNGLPTKEYSNIVGARVKQAVKRGQPVKWDVLR